MTDQELLERIHEAFLFMPALHGAVSGYRIKDVRAEVNGAIGYFWQDLCDRLER